MAKPGPAPRPALAVVREGNQGHHSSDRLSGGLKLKPNAPEEPSWSDWWPSVRLPTVKALKGRWPVEVIEGQFTHIEDDKKRVYLAEARQRWLIHTERETAKRAQQINRRARAVARTTWRRIVPILDAEGLLTDLDEPVLVELCRTNAQIDQAVRDIAERGMWVQGERGAMKNPSTTVVNQLRTHLKWLVGELGLSPVARDALPSSEDGSDGGGPFD